MLLLLAFAAIAGAGAALTPCVLPVLPALLSASATGGSANPLGIITGLVVTHTLAIVAVASVIDGVDLADGFLRPFAICVLALFDLGLLLPGLGERIERPLARLGRFGPGTRGDGFRSGLVVGGALGFVYAPCAGPIVAAVIALSATQGASAAIVAGARLRRRLCAGVAGDRLRWAPARRSTGGAPAAARRFSARSARSCPRPRS